MFRNQQTVSSQESSESDNIDLHQEQRGTASNYNTINAKMQAFNQLLHSLQLQIDELSKKLQSSEYLEKNYDKMKAEEMAAREKCISPKTEMKDLFEEVQSHSFSDSLHKGSDEMLNYELLRQEHEELQKELEGLQEQNTNKRVIEKNCEALKTLTDEMRAENKGLQKEIQRLKEERDHIKDLNDYYSSEKEQSKFIIQHNNGLQEEIRKLQREVMEAKSLLKDKYEMNISTEALNHQNKALQQELQSLRREYDQMKDRDAQCGGVMAHMSALKKENETLQGQINVIRENIQMRKALKELEAEEKVLQAHSRTLIKTHSDVSGQLLTEEDWR